MSLRLRASLLLALLALFVLVDEAIREGYLFDPRDIATPTIPPSHEQLFIILLSAALILGYRWRR
ncbi:MAG: hypothetical protein QXO86_03440 [Nitrososphaerota archaeon]